MTVLSFAASDFDQLRETTRRLLIDGVNAGPVRLADPLQFELKAVSLGGVTAAVFTYGGCEIEGTAGGVGTDYSVTISLGGAWSLERDREELMVTGSTASVAQADRPVAVRRFEAPGEETLMVKFAASALETELERMIGREIGGPIDFGMGRIDLRSGHGADWKQIVGTLLGALRGESELVLHPLLRPQIASTIMTGLLLTSGHPYRDEIDARIGNVRPPLIERAIRVLEERAAQPITVSDVAAEVGCSVRSLFAGFQRHVGISPYRYLERVRMDGARADLVAGNPASTTVSQVAATWGLLNRGRFAATYRRLYGESPSETLRGD